MNKNEKNFNIPKSDFDKMNTKSDPSQINTPIPFQLGDFSSSNYEKSQSKSILEIIVFYVLGIALSISGYLVFIKMPIFEDIVKDTKLSIIVLITIILTSFIISKLVQMYIKKKKL